MDDYSAKQASMHDKYKQDYRKWLRSLSPEERAKAESLGLGEPARMVSNPCQSVRPVDDTTERHMPHSLMVVSEDVEREGPESAQAAAADVIRRMVGCMLVEADKPGMTARLVVDGLGIACHVVTIGGIQSICKRHSLDPLDLLEIAEKLQEAIGLPLIGASSMEHDALRQVGRGVVGEILRGQNARFAMECLALATGIAYTGISQVAIGKKFAVTRSAVSKRCVELTDNLGLPPSRAMRTEDARKVYSEAQKEREYAIAS